MLEEYLIGNCFSDACIIENGRICSVCRIHQKKSNRAEWRFWNAQMKEKGLCGFLERCNSLVVCGAGSGKYIKAGRAAFSGEIRVPQYRCR